MVNYSDISDFSETRFTTSYFQQMIHFKNGAECELFVRWSMNYFGVDYQLFWSELSIIFIILGA